MNIKINSMRHMFRFSTAFTSANPLKNAFRFEN